MTPIEDTMIHAAERFLAHHSTAAAAVLPLADGKVVAVGTEAELRTMIAGSINYAWKPNILQLAKACDIYEEYESAGKPEQGMVKAMEYLAARAPALPDTVQPAAPSIPRQMVIHAIMGAGFPSMQMADEYTKLKLAKFTGNQWNENWDWDSDALSKLTNLELATIYSRVTA